jgi:hypothetical protein
VAGVRRLMEFQKETNYYDLYMNEETSRYVFRIMAKEMVQLNMDLKSIKDRYRIDSY